MTTVLEGTIDTIFPTEIRKSFETRAMWLKEDKPNYPNTWNLTFTGGSGSVLDKFKPGDKVICNIVVKGFKWSKDGKEAVFTTLDCQLIKKKN